MHITKIRVPADIQFADLCLERDPVTGDILFDAKIIRDIAEDNDLAWTEDVVNAILTGWYHHHRAIGGAPDPVMEQIIAEVEVEGITGVEIRGGSGGMN